MKRPTLGSLAGVLTRKASKPAVQVTKNWAAELARWKVTVDVSVPLGGSPQVEVRDFSVRLKKVNND